MNNPPLHALGFHANNLSRTCGDERMKGILQWVGVGSVILMGAAAGVHLIKDLLWSGKEYKFSHEPFSKRRYEGMLDDLDRHYKGREPERGR